MNTKTWITFFLALAVSVASSAKTFTDADYHYRIKGLPDSTAIKHNGESILLFQSGDETVILFRYRANDEMRMKYSYFRQLDSLVFDLFPSDMIKQRDPLFYSKMTREYDQDGELVRTVAIYARQYVYVFGEQYENEPALLETILNGFKTSRTGCIQNLTAMLQDRLSGEKYIWSFLWGTLFALIRLSWCGGIAVILFLFVICPAISKNRFFGLIITLLSIFVFFYLTLHDYLLDWLMGFDGFFTLFYHFFSMFSAN